MKVVAALVLISYSVVVVAATAQNFIIGYLVSAKSVSLAAGNSSYECVYLVGFQRKMIVQQEVCPEQKKFLM